MWGASLLIHPQRLSVLPIVVSKHDLRHDEVTSSHWVTVCLWRRWCHWRLKNLNTDWLLRHSVTWWRPKSSIFSTSSDEAMRRWKSHRVIRISRSDIVCDCISTLTLSRYHVNCFWSEHIFRITERNFSKIWGMGSKTCRNTKNLNEPQIIQGMWTILTV